MSLYDGKILVKRIRLGFPPPLPPPPSSPTLYSDRIFIRKVPVGLHLDIANRLQRQFGTFGFFIWIFFRPRFDRLGSPATLWLIWSFFDKNILCSMSSIEFEFEITYLWKGQQFLQFLRLFSLCSVWKGKTRRIYITSRPRLSNLTCLVRTLTEKYTSWSLSCLSLSQNVSKWDFKAESIYVKCRDSLNLFLLNFASTLEEMEEM